MEKNLDITKPRNSEQILLVPWSFVILRFHCIFLRAQPLTRSLITSVSLTFSHVELTQSIKLEHFKLHK